MAITYSKKMLIERVVKHMNNNFPSEDWSITSNEILMYIDSSIPFVLKGHMFEMAKVTGVLDVPDAYLVSYSLPILTQDASTKEWLVILPQTPIELPSGYDVTNVYIKSSIDGRSQNAFPLKTKRVAYRNYMPKPSGFFYRLEGQEMYLQQSDGGSLLNYDLNVQMPVSRTASIDDPMTLPDGALEPLFQKTVAQLIQRFGLPQDIVQDGLPQGNKAS